MVSSLKLWHHPEHRRLWPIVSGLSVLAHIGILGLSLPYVLNLMQSDSGTQVSASIPIELVDALPSAELSAEADSVSNLKRNDSLTQTLAPSQSAGAASSSKRQSSSPSRATSDSQQDAIAANSITTPTRSPNSSVGQDRSGAVPADQPEAETASQSDGTGTLGEQPSEKDDAAEGSSANSGADSTEASSGKEVEGGAATDSGAGGSTGLATVPGGGETLSPPGQSSSVSQQTSLSIVNFSEVPVAQRSDLGKTPPQPKADVLSSEIVIDPVSRNCPLVTFSQQRWTYRVAVNPNGSVRTASIWTEGVGREMTQEERAIACLIENAGFEFEPALALSDGQPILDDNLLIEIDIAEAR